MKKDTGYNPYWMIAALLLAASCAKAPDASLREPVAFSVTVEEGEMQPTRATGEIGSLATLKTEGFGVFAYDTGRYLYGDNSLNPNFMYNQPVEWNAGVSHWEYNPVKYWPNGEGEVSGNTGTYASHVSFFAYAPYSDGDGSDPAGNPAGYCITSMINQDDPGNPWLLYRLAADVADQVDLLYAPREVDRTKPSVSEAVSFDFYHALACVGEKVRVDCSDNMKAQLAAEAVSGGQDISVRLVQVTVDYYLTARAKLSLWDLDGDPNWQLVTNGELATHRIVEYGNWSGAAMPTLYSSAGGGGEWASADGMGVFYIPLDMAGGSQTATITVNFIVRRGSTDTAQVRQATITLHDFPGSFAPGKKLSNLFLTLE